MKSQWDLRQLGTDSLMNRGGYPIWTGVSPKCPSNQEKSVMGLGQRAGAWPDPLATKHN